jgi:adenylate cyclase
VFNWLAKLLRKIPIPISIKWTIYIGTLITLVMGVLGWFLITQQNNFHMREVQGFGEILVEQLAHSASEPLLADDQFNLQGLVSRQTQNRNVVGAAIVPSDKPWVISGKVPEEIPSTDNLDPMIWSWRDDQKQAHSAVTFFSPINFRDVVAGHAILTLDREFIDRDQERTIRIISYATIGLILIAAILSYVLSRRLSRPITILAEAGRVGEHGALVSQQDLGRQDEIGQIYAHFDRMTVGMLEKRQVEDALSRYVSPVVAEKILSNLSQQRLPNQEMEGSVLFCDIVGFTQLSEDLPADEVADLLNLYLGAIADAAHRCRGVVDKFIGDSAMILFGVPEPDREHGAQAVSCAWLIQVIVRHINKQRKTEGKEPIMLRIGINSGHMQAGNIGIPDRLEYTVVGDSVNLASRLCGAAPADGIMMSESTASFPGVASMVDLHQQPALKIRGRKSLVKPSIAGTPSREFGQWLMQTMSHILNKNAE